MGISCRGIIEWRPPGELWRTFAVVYCERWNELFDLLCQREPPMPDDERVSPFPVRGWPVDASSSVDEDERDWWVDTCVSWLTLDELLSVHEMAGRWVRTETANAAVAWTAILEAMGRLGMKRAYAPSADVRFIFGLDQ